MKPLYVEWRANFLSSSSTTKHHSTPPPQVPHPIHPSSLIARPGWVVDKFNFRHFHDLERIDGGSLLAFSSSFSLPFPPSVPSFFFFTLAYRNLLPVLGFEDGLVGWLDGQLVVNVMLCCTVVSVWWQVSWMVKKFL